MTVLQVAKDAATKCGFNVPTTLIGTDRTLVEISEALNDTAQSIRDEYDWSVLKKQHSLTGTGVLEDFDLPTDFARMVKTGHVWPSNMPNWPLDHVTDEDQWLQLDAQDFTTVNGRWTLYGGQMHIKPAPTSGVVLKYFYIRNGVFRNGASTSKTFTLDNDVFELDERLLKLAFVWRWKRSKGQTYAAELDDYEDALATAIGADKGPRAFAVGSKRYPGNVTTAYPGVITP